MEPENLSRRSFIKKTTVLTVGISSATLFSGLVHADTPSSHRCLGCAPVGVCVAHMENDEQNGWECTMSEGGKEVPGWCSSKNPPYGITFCWS